MNAQNYDFDDIRGLGRTEFDKLRGEFNELKAEFNYKFETCVKIDDFERLFNEHTKQREEAEKQKHTRQREEAEKQKHNSTPSKGGSKNRKK